MIKPTTRTLLNAPKIFGNIFFLAVVLFAKETNGALCREGDDWGLNVVVNITTANSASSNYWTITRENGQVIRREDFQNYYFNYVDELCLDSTKCHIFEINGIFYGPDLNSLTVDGKVYDEDDLHAPTYYDDGYYGDDDYYTTHVPLISKTKFGTCISPSPSTVPSELSSKEPSLEPSHAPSTKPSIKPSPVPPSSPTTEDCPNGTKKFKLRLKTDDYGAETSFKVVQRNNRRGTFNKVIFQEPRFRSNEELFFERCLNQKKCYKVIIADSFGDGMCCEHGDGFWKGYWKGKGLAREIKGDFTDGKVSRSRMFGKCS